MRRILFAPLLLTLASCGRDRTEPATQPPGATESAKTRVLEAGAKALQDDGPAAVLDIHLVGFHPLRDHPHQQMEAHHFCRQVNEEFAQCALFDGDTAQANLTGVEYLISENLFQRLPPEERRYWHPHNGEILSGQLSAPDLPLTAEKALMRSKLNSYGKTCTPGIRATARSPAMPCPWANPCWPGRSIATANCNRTCRPAATPSPRTAAPNCAPTART
ncbi:hypothetical protein NB721_000805 [Xanthomonas sacchari]|nr:hypothetical protein [Xanthomonas sacchari]